MRRSIVTLLLISLLSGVAPLARRDRDHGSDFGPMKIIKNIIHYLIPTDGGGLIGPPKP